MSELPAARTDNGTRVARGAAFAVCLAIALVSVVGAHAYQRPAPVPEQPAPGMKVGKDQTGDFLSLDPGAPEWSVVATALPSPPEPRWTDPLPARVVFDESRTSRLGSPLAGRVSAVYVERGQAVKAGQPLFAVSSPNLAELDAAQKVAEVELKTAKTEYDRTQRAVDAQVLPGKELVAAKQKLDEAEVALRLAQQKRSSLRVTGAGDSAAFTVSAPRDGVVVERQVALGQTVSPDSGSLMAIADLSSVWVVADIFRTSIPGLARGARARVVIDNGAEGDREGTIDQIASVVDPDRHAVPVRIRLDNPEGTLRPNAYVQVRLFDPTPTKATLPSSAVMSDGKKSFVYVEKPKGVFRRRDVTVGSVIGGKVPVTAGLELDERVIVQGAILVDNEIALEN
ncbi:MAG TPA: efflux RND transporter periplasmic adaptor subunit [Kofleriaceae bacterium]|nr:efflux RND transporter periplasmic adaptor subunit [Kofleriaceae bacterium]